MQYTQSAVNSRLTTSDAGKMNAVASMSACTIHPSQMPTLPMRMNPSASTQASAVTPTLLGVTPALPADGRYRTVYQGTIALRNRLYGS